MNLVQHISAVKQTENTIFSELDEHTVKREPVKITLKEDSQPYRLSAAQRVPIPLLGKVKEELARMEKTGIIKKVEAPMDWCAPMVPVLKKNAKIRICTDYKKLNTAVKRKRCILPALEGILHKLKGSSIYSKLDATSGVWQIPLDEESAKLTTFITHSGHFFYHRLPQGITSAPEIFQRKRTHIWPPETCSCYGTNSVSTMDC